MSFDLSLSFLSLYTVILFFCSFLLLNVKSNVNFIFSCLFICLFSYFIGFRVGDLDYSNYEIYFERTPDLISYIKDGELYFYVEPGYIYLNSIFKMVSCNFNFFLFFISIVSISLIFYSYNRMDKNYVLMSILYIASSLYSMYFTQIRTGLACSIVMLAIVLLSNGKFICYLILSFLAISIHTSAILILFLPLYRYVKASYLLISISILFGFLFTQYDVFKVFIDMVSTLFLPDVISNKVELYVNSGRDNVKQGFFTISNAISILTMCMYFYIVFKIKPEVTLIMKMSFFIVLFGFLLNNLFSFYGEVAARFYRVGFVMVPYVWIQFYSRLDLYKKFTNLPLMFFAFILFVYYGHFNKIVPPYKNYWGYWFGLS